MTRHRRSKHETTATANTPTIDIEIVKKILPETVEKLREEDIYPGEILDTISSLKPSEPQVNLRNIDTDLYHQSTIQEIMDHKQHTIDP